MRPGLPVWWDAPAAAEGMLHDETQQEFLIRMAAERAIVEPVLVHLRPLCTEGGVAAVGLAEQTDFQQWKWAILWNAARSALEEGLLRARNDDHEKWLAKIVPALGDGLLPYEENKRRGDALREFRKDPCTLSFMMYMKDTVGELMMRCVAPGYSRPW